ncbi:AcrR family transcriptional regulator [Novosphingobium chloroacetimidivorans]|uniref:AcrR family transcriptional regulator n=1 Tax=Novosphingobium chloroacetimidivorans TaxID=1428314 RepID=A0A7W7KAR1_9SPHN|nr:TetR/AcrR family transcriptional regulator [Novosphingobium chloroacetimidivorans]MBB4858819.1 AcrR family transcriptional regulator [Novosphingobium chloroacetimidivorans]
MEVTPPRRRMGSPDSAVSNQLLDATERVMREEGYAAATSRRIAEEAGLKQQLVYYYFETMDDLLLAAFKRRTSRALERIDEEAASRQPIQTIWESWNSTVDAKLVFEFFALANHHDGVREEVNRFMAAARRKHAEAIARQVDEHGLDLGPFSPEALSFMLFSTALLLGREEAMGLTIGHTDVRKLFDWGIARIG